MSHHKVGIGISDVCDQVQEFRVDELATVAAALARWITCDNHIWTIGQSCTHLWENLDL